MGPETNPRLFNILEKTTIDRAINDHDRRERLSVQMESLDKAFSAMGRSPQKISETTIFPKLLALQSLDKSSLGIAGMDNISTAIHAHCNEPAVEAAPIHDTADINGKQLATRLIKFPNDNSSVRLFGINIFGESQNEYEDTSLQDIVHDEAPLAVLAVDSQGKTIDKEVIHGETPFFIAWNKESKDVKFYKVTQNEKLTLTEPHLRPSIYESLTTVNMSLPDGFVIRVEQLVEEDEQAIIREIMKALDSIEENIEANRGLSANERNALASLDLGERNFEKLC